MNIVEFAKKMHLLKVLFDGGILYKDHNDDEGRREFLFYSEACGIFEIRGWSTAYGTADQRVMEVILKPERWKVFPHNISEGHPYPWSASYKKEEK